MVENIAASASSPPTFTWGQADSISPAAIALTRVVDRRYLRVNARFLDIVGVPERDVVGRTTEEIGFELPATDRVLIQRALAARGRVERMVVMYKSRERELYVELSTHPVTYEGELCLLTQLIDVTRERNLRSHSRAHAETWRTLAQNVPDYIWTLGGDGRIVECNRDPLQREKDALVGSEHASLLRQEDRDRVAAIHARVLAVGAPATYEADVQGVHGHSLFHHRVSRIVSSGGEPRLLVVSTDLGEWREMQRRLEDADRRAREILQSTTDAFVHVDGEWMLTELNAHAERLFGANADDFIGKSLWDAYPPARAMPFEAELRRVRDTGIATHFEHTFAGAPQRFEIHAYRTVRGVAAYFRDVTQRYLAEHRLAESEQRYRTIVELASDMVVITRADIIQYVSPAAQPILGYHPAELVGTSANELVHPDEQTRGGLDEPGSFERSMRVRRKDGTYAHLEIRGKILPGATETISVARDVTTRVLAQAEREATLRESAQREKLSALGTLVAGVAHEINNPLSFLRGSAELLSMGLDDLRGDETIPVAVRARLDAFRIHEAAMVRGADRIEHITRSLKRVARKPTGQREPLQINEIVESALLVAGSRIPPHVTARAELGELPTVLGEPAELVQVLLNLILNAGEAMSAQTTGELVVRTRLESAQVVIEVQDAGPGIPEEMVASVFTPFSTSKPQGTGLGLSISLGIVEAHGGRLTFTTGQSGTTFRIELPA